MGKTIPIRMKNLLILLLAIILLAGCVQPAPGVEPWKLQPQPEGVVGAAGPTPEAPPPPTPTVRYLFPTRDPSAPLHTPTPDQPRTLPQPRTEDISYTVRPGDTLTRISQWNGVPVNVLVSANNLANPNLLEVGDILTIPAPRVSGQGPAAKIIPDSELVAGPSSADFNLQAYLETAGGYLLHYVDDHGEKDLSGPQVIERVAREYSVNPRLLLAVVEYQSHWISQGTPPEVEANKYPLGYAKIGYEGLYRQLSFAANQLNRGFYSWQTNALSGWYLADDSFVTPDPTLNAGTIGVQTLFAQLLAKPQWEYALSSNGFAAQFEKMFGFAFNYALEPLLPPGLAQPPLQLPLEDGVPWSFTGGPHGGWGSYSAWAAIDFAPPGDELGCFDSDEWVVAAADGQILFSSDGLVLQDLEGDGSLQVGWTLMYMHIATRDRIPAGTTVKAGDRIGHPSCEGGFSNGTHVHFARRYDGTWLAAVGLVPLDMDGWRASGDGYEYNGWLTRDGISIEAWNGRSEANQISR